MFHLCKQEKTEFPANSRLTFNGICGTLNMLGRFNHRPVFMIQKREGQEPLPFLSLGSQVEKAQNSGAGVGAQNGAYIADVNVFDAVIPPQNFC